MPIIKGCAFGTTVNDGRYAYHKKQQATALTIITRKEKINLKHNIINKKHKLKNKIKCRDIRELYKSR